MHDLTNQLEKIHKHIKTNPSNVYKMGKYITFSDTIGWSNGYIADLTDKNLSEVKHLVKKYKMEIPINEESFKQEVKKVIPSGSHIVESIQFDLDTNDLILINKTVTTRINPDFLMYFYHVYVKNEKFVKTKLILTQQYLPVKVIVNEKLVALIMPIKRN